MKELAARDSTLAAQSRLCIRKYRRTGDPQALEDHKQARAELERRGHTQQFGELGWDDAVSV